MKKNIVLVFVMLSLIIALACMLGMPSIGVMTSDTAPKVLIDPGHGGVDGGSSAADGTLEKHINLSVSLQLRDVLEILGYSVTMTRQTDISIHDPECQTIRDKKVSDMRHRLEMYEQSSLVIAIHQNHFSSPQYRGSQVFYAASDPRSEQLAVAMQSSLCRYVQPENTRECKKAADGLYLMRHTTRPTVLVECGFLSHPEELENLKTDSYRRQLAVAIAAGLLNYATE